jgi:hypothetical protein
VTLVNLAIIATFWQLKQSVQFNLNRQTLPCWAVVKIPSPRLCWVCFFKKIILTLLILESPGEETESAADEPLFKYDFVKRAYEAW